MVTRTKATLFFFGVLFLVVGLCAITIQVYYNCSLIETEGVIIELAPEDDVLSDANYYKVRYNDMYGNTYEARNLFSSRYQIGNSVSLYYFEGSPQRLENARSLWLFFVPVLFFAGLFLTLGRSVIIHWREVINQNKGKCLFSLISCVLCFVFSILLVYYDTSTFIDVLGLGNNGLGYYLLVLLSLLLVALVNIVMWLIVFLKSFSK